MLKQKKVKKGAKAMIKLIVADMDGTLLNDNNEINEEFWEVHKN